MPEWERACYNMPRAEAELMCESHDYGEQDCMNSSITQGCCHFNPTEARCFFGPGRAEESDEDSDSNSSSSDSDSNRCAWPRLTRNPINWLLDVLLIGWWVGAATCPSGSVPATTCREPRPS
jgi:hypothetical protein